MLWNGLRMGETRELVCWLALSIQGANRCWVSEWINSEIWLLHTGPRPCCLPPRVQPPHMMQHQRQDAIMISCHVPPHWETNSCFGIQNTQVAYNLIDDGNPLGSILRNGWGSKLKLLCRFNVPKLKSGIAMKPPMLAAAQFWLQPSGNPILTKAVRARGMTGWNVLVNIGDLRESAKNPEWNYRCIQKWYHRDWKQHPSPNWGTQAFTWSWLVQPLVDPTLKSPTKVGLENLGTMKCLVVGINLELVHIWISKYLNIRISIPSEDYAMQYDSHDAWSHGTI